MLEEDCVSNIKKKELCLCDVLCMTVVLWRALLANTILWFQVSKLCYD